MVDRIVRKGEAARILGLSPTSLWRLERTGALVPVRVMPGVSGYRESILQAFIDSMKSAPPDRERVAAALASPLHGRAGRADGARKGAAKGAGRTESTPSPGPSTVVREPAPKASKPGAKPITISQTPACCADCGSKLVNVEGRVYSCADEHGFGCKWLVVVEACA